MYPFIFYGKTYKEGGKRDIKTTINYVKLKEKHVAKKGFASHTIVQHGIYNMVFARLSEVHQNLQAVLHMWFLQDETHTVIYLGQQFFHLR
jgi:hypothetical protein